MGGCLGGWGCGCGWGRPAPQQPRVFTVSHGEVGLGEIDRGNCLRVCG